MANQRWDVPPWGSDEKFSKNIFVPIRLTLALLVIYSHSFWLSGGNPNDPLAAAVDMSLGPVAVNFFLAISGFLVMRSWESSATTWDYLAKRIRRIYPAFIVLMVIQSFMLIPFTSLEPFTGYSLRQLGLILFSMIDLVGYGFPFGGLYTPFPNNPIPNVMNSSLWTIRYEFICYLILPIFGSFLRHKWLCLCSLIAALSLFMSNRLPPWNFFLTVALGDVVPWPRFLTFFLAGVTFYRFRKFIPYSISIAISAFVVTLVAGVLWPTGLSLLLATCGIYFSFFVAYNPIFEPLAQMDIGDPSYGTYLYACPIQQLIVLFINGKSPMNANVLTAASIPLSILAGLISWHLVEKRFLYRKPKKVIEASSRKEI